MKIPYDINSLSYISGSSKLKNSSSKEALRHKLNANRFNAILDDEIKGMKPGDSFPMNNNTLQLLIGIVRRQIDAHLIGVALTKLGSGSFPGLLLEGIKNAKPQPVSINQQSLPEKDESLTMNHTNRIIDRASKKYGVDSDLIKAVIKAESDFDVNSTSSKGAMGLMQLMPETAKDMGVKDPYNPEENIMGGTRYLKMLLDRYKGDRNVALAAYNWGMGNVERNPGRLPEETKTYIARVNKYHKSAIS